MLPHFQVQQWVQGVTTSADTTPVSLGVPSISDSESPLPAAHTYVQNHFLTLNHDGIDHPTDVSCNHLLPPLSPSPSPPFEKFLHPMGFVVPDFVQAALDEKDKEGFAYAWRTAATLHAEFAYNEDRYWAMLRSAQSAPDELSSNNFWQAAIRYKRRSDKANQHLTNLKPYIDAVVDVAFSSVHPPSHRALSPSTILQQQPSARRDAMMVSC